MSHRTHITLTDEQYTWLKRESARTGLGLAELVRRALAAVYSDGSTQDPMGVLAASFGAWQDREADGAAYVEDLRRGIAGRLAR